MSKSAQENVFEFPPSGRENLSVDEARTDILRLIQFDGLRQSLIAKEAGVSESTLSQFISGGYKGDNAAVAAKLRAWLELRKKRLGAFSAVPEIQGFLETPTAKRIVDTLSYAHMFSDVAAIYGGKGLGKTAAAKHYARTAPNVFYMRAKEEASSVSGILVSLAYAVGVRSPEGLIPARLSRLVAGALRATRGLLIVDEAQLLSRGALETLRGFHDEIGIGLAMLGNVAVYGRIYGTSARAEEFAQLSSRVGIRLPLARPAAGDVHVIAGALNAERSPDWKEMRPFLERIAQRPGGLREIEKTLRLAWALAIGAGDELRLRHVQAAWMQRHGAADAAEEG